MTDKLDITDIDKKDDVKSNGVVKAIALKHERGEGSAPHIVASGKGHIAEQIIELAFANDVKVRKDSDLTDILTELDIDSPIPLEAYAAVAEILAYVYKANANVGVHRVTENNDGR